MKTTSAFSLTLKTGIRFSSLPDNTFFSHTRKFILSCALVFLFGAALKANTTTTRGGSLTMYTSLGAAHLDARLLLTDMPTSVDSALIQWGDGTEESIPLTAHPTISVNGHYLVTIQSIGHGFPFGGYTVKLSCGRRASWIRNIPNSDTTTFSLQAYILLHQIIASNSTEISDSLDLSPDMSLAMVNTVTPLWMSIATDSLNWGLSNPLGAYGYTYPDISGGGNFNLYPGQNYCEWNPQTAGLYSVAFTCTQRQELQPGTWLLMSKTTCEVLIDAGQVSSVFSPMPAQSVLVHPNPTSDIITFQFSESQQTRSIIIYDELGKAIWRDETYSNSIALSVTEFANGLYFYSVFGEFGDQSSGRFVVNH